MFRLGRVTEREPTSGRVRVALLDEGGSETYWLHVLVGRAGVDEDQCVPDVDETVAVLLDERGESGVVLGAIYTGSKLPTAPDPDVRRVRFSDGTVLEYDRATHVLGLHGSILVEVDAHAITLGQRAARAWSISPPGVVDGPAAALVEGGPTGGGYVAFAIVANDDGVSSLLLSPSSEQYGTHGEVAYYHEEHLMVFFVGGPGGGLLDQLAIFEDHIESRVPLKVGAGASPVALASKITTELIALKNAISSAPVAPTDGGASFKAGLLTALASWPGDIASEDLTSD